MSASGPEYIYIIVVRLRVSRNELTFQETDGLEANFIRGERTGAHD